MNIAKMMKQAQAMQQNMEKVQAELAEKTFEFSSGGGMVTAVANGEGSLTSLKIDPKVVDPEDVEMLEDLIFAAIDGAIKDGKAAAAKEMGALTQGMNIPGMPF